jgi:hypothetical protein
VVPGIEVSLDEPQLTGSLLPEARLDLLPEQSLRRFVHAVDS